MAGDHLQVLVPRAAVTVVVLNPHIRKSHVAIVVRQVVFAGPLSDLDRVAVGPTVRVPFAAVPLLQEPLIVALELVVEHDTANATAFASGVASQRACTRGRP